MEKSDKWKIYPLRMQSLVTTFQARHEPASWGPTKPLSMMKGIPKHKHRELGVCSFRGMLENS